MAASAARQHSKNRRGSCHGSFGGWSSGVIGSGSGRRGRRCNHSRSRSPRRSRRRRRRRRRHASC